MFGAQGGECVLGPKAAATDRGMLEHRQFAPTHCFMPPRSMGKGKENHGAESLRESPFHTIYLLAQAGPSALF